ncbi:MAG: hypothetical protein V1725_05755 [archaeon]
MENIDTVDKAVLEKLFSRRVINSRKPHHMRLTTLAHCGWKPHERNKIRTSVEKLVRLGLIVWIKKSKGALALNLKKYREIKDLVH